MTNEALVIARTERNKQWLVKHMPDYDPDWLMIPINGIQGEMTPPFKPLYIQPDGRLRVRLINV